MSGEAVDIFRDAMAEAEPGADALGSAPEPQAVEPTPQAAEPDQGVAPSSGQADPSSPQPARQEPEQTRVPLAELLAEREKRQRYEAQVAEFQRQFEQLQQQREQQAPPDLFVDPENYLRHQMQPYERQMQQMRAEMHHAMMHNARMAAAATLGADKVKDAEEAYNRAVNDRTIDSATAHRINASPNPFEAAVEWRRQQLVLQEVGSDPAAYRRWVLDEALKDPAYLARAMDAHRQMTHPAGSRPLSLPSANRASAAPGSDDDGPADAVDAFRNAMRGR